jgi:Tfp pilus assembly protein PilF
MKTRYRAQILCVLAGLLYYERNDPDRALPYLREAVALAPRAELASIPLFHVLMAKKSVDEAFDEARRFLALKESPEYRQLFREWNQADDVDDKPEPSDK